jgi:hypothetical protein
VPYDASILRCSQKTSLLLTMLALALLIAASALAKFVQDPNDKGPLFDTPNAATLCSLAGKDYLR